VIARLAGTVDSTGRDSMIVDVGGVGYLVFCSARALARIPPPGHAVTLHIETHVREDHIHLYGFLDARERDWFRLLLGVQGIGGRLALSVLGALGPERLAEAIALEDRTVLTQADGVGPRLATRLVTELKDKVEALAPLAHTAASPTDEAATPADDAVSALVHLGYGRLEAVGAVRAASRRLGERATLESLVRGGLKELAA